MKKLIELFETQIKLDKENRINYSILNAKNHLIKNLIELQINKDEKNNVIDLIYSTLRGDRNYHYLTYDHFKFFLTDLMIYFNHNLKIDKVELVKIYLKNISKN